MKAASLATVEVVPATIARLDAIVLIEKKSLTA
jgi:hypothetical protein